MYAKARMVASFFTTLLVCLIIVEVARCFAASREVGGANFSDIKAILALFLCMEINLIILLRNTYEYICTFPVAALVLMLDGFPKAQSVQYLNEFFFIKSVLRICIISVLTKAYRLCVNTL
jgi:hypothetical protein